MGFWMENECFRACLYKLLECEEGVIGNRVEWKMICASDTEKWVEVFGLSPELLRNLRIFEIWGNHNRSPKMNNK